MALIVVRLGKVMRARLAELCNSKALKRTRVVKTLILNAIREGLTVSPDTLKMAKAKDPLDSRVLVLRLKDQEALELNQIAKPRQRSSFIRVLIDRFINEQEAAL